MNRIDNQPRVFILAVPEQLPPDQTIWGTGGWIPPEDREALDWLVLVKTLGWHGVPIYPSDVEGCLRSLSDAETIIVACDPEQLPAETASLLEQALARIRFSLIARVAARTSAEVPRLFMCKSEGRVSGQTLVWNGASENKTWFCPETLDASSLPTRSDTRVLATLDGSPIITEHRCGAGRCVALGFHPSSFADQSGEAIALLRQVLTCDPHVPRAWLDWSRTMVLRMDDPGGAQNIYSRNWCYRKLHRPQWRQLGDELAKRQARISIGYVSGWVDDGDAQRGTLWVGGAKVSRKAGAIYASPLIRYLDHAGHLPSTDNDYRSEYLGIQDLRTAGLADVELHGLTHMHPDLDTWLDAPDRYENRSWFRDFASSGSACLQGLPLDQHPLNRGMALLHEHFQTVPTCLICPGDEWTQDVLTHALNLDLDLVSSYYLAIRHANRFIWSSYICAPYLDQPAPKWFSSGLPVIGYFHDFEPATKGVAWLATHLDAWQQAGARRFIDFRETAIAFGLRLYLEHQHGRLTLHVGHEKETIARPRSVPVKVRIHEGRLPDTILCRLGQEEHNVAVCLETETEGWVAVPCSKQ